MNKIGNIMMTPYPERNLPGLFKCYITALISIKIGDFCFVEYRAVSIIASVEQGE